MRLVEFYQIIEDIKQDLARAKYAAGAYKMVYDYISKHNESNNWGFMASYIPGGGIKYFIENVNTRFSMIKKIFVHEFTHLMDEIRTNDKIPKSAKNFDKSGDYLSYYSNPSEYNAFFQETLDQIDDYLDRFVYSIPKEVQKTLVDKVMGNGIFQDFVKNVKSKFFPKGFELTQQYERKLVKRLYGYYQYIIPKLREKGLM